MRVEWLQFAWQQAVDAWMDGNVQEVEPQSAPGEEVLLAHLAARPEDDSLRLVYADWLEERGMDSKASFLRAQVRGSTRGWPVLLDPDWLAQIERAPVERVRPGPGYTPEGRERWR
jgi:uncharacterized protein (TIGR02996 family)